MPKFETTHRVKHPADDMFALVADVTRYPEFVPLCKSLIVRGRKNDDVGRVIIIADMTVAYKMFSETFTSKVTLDQEQRIITAEYLDGPFKHMENRWTFRPVGESSCDVVFFIDYELRSRTLAALVGTVFERAFRRFSSAFEARADAIYGV